MKLKEQIEEIIAGAIVEDLTIEEASERILLLLNVTGSLQNECVYKDGEHKICFEVNKCEKCKQ